MSLFPREPHHHVVIRAQLLASEASVGRAVVLTPPPSQSQRFPGRMSLPGLNRTIGPDIETSLRLLRASCSADQIRREMRERHDDVVKLANESDLVLVGQRRTLPWLFAPLGRDALRLLRRSGTPVLVVGRKPKGPYRHVVVATDLETDVTAALAWARRVAPRASVTLLHVYRGLFESKLQWAGVPEEQILEHRLGAQYEAALGLAALLKQHDPNAVTGALLTHGWAGAPEIVRRSRELGADLIVVARNNHSSWMEVLGASVSVETATSADRDVLVVHEPSGGGPVTFTGRAT
jgi:nucleotide-binding universal stress UspA family protein